MILSGLPPVMCGSVTAAMPGDLAPNRALCGHLPGTGPHHASARNRYAAADHRLGLAPPGMSPPGAAAGPAAGASSAGVWTGQQGQRLLAMSTGTAVGFMATGSIMLMAIVVAVWLEARMPEQREQHLKPPRQLRQPYQARHRS
jgi:hypothetical protein